MFKHLLKKLYEMLKVKFHDCLKSQEYEMYVKDYYLGLDFCPQIY